MLNRKFIYHGVLLSAIALSMLLFPLATGLYSQTSRAYAGQPFNTVPPVNATFTAPVATSVPLPTPLPTLGPGQYFEQDDNLPQVTRPDLLGEPFGYTEIIGKPKLYLVWSTDDDGNKHYYTLDKKNTYFKKIMTAVDADRIKYEMLIENDPTGKFWANLFGAVRYGFAATACGVGAFFSLSLEPISLPLTGLLVTCTGGAGKVSTEYFNSAVDNWSDLRGYEFIKEERRKEIEGYFVQIPYSFQD